MEVKRQLVCVRSVAPPCFLRCAVTRKFPNRCQAVSKLSTAPNPGVAASLAESSIAKWTAPFILPIAALIATSAYCGSVALGRDAPWLQPFLVATGPILLNGIMPILDWLVGKHRPQPLPAAAKVPAADDFAARILPTLVITTHLTVAVASYAAISAGPAQSIPLLLLLSVSLGVSATSAMAASHELVHSRNPLHLAVTALFLTAYWWYPYYRVHHQHHLHVCTPVDYTCAPKGLNAYSYILQYIKGSYAEAWQLAAEECDRNCNPRLSHHNSTLVAFVAQALLTTAVWAKFGPSATALHLASGIVLLVYMSVFDYVLHYGLLRPPLPGSEHRNTPITPYNSWNSLFPLENLMFCNVLYHSDHHMYAVKSHGCLRPLPDSPTYPIPINLLAMSVFVPPLWMTVMDGRADEANSKHLQCLGITP